MNVRVLLAVAVGACLLLMLSLPAAPQAKGGEEKLDRLEGRIQSIDKAAGVITILVGRSAMPRKVVYNDQTKYTTRNEPKGAITDLKDGVRIICLGKFNDKNQLVAARIDIR
jgi:hypothetical protein